MSRRKQSHPKPVKRDDLPSQMDEDRESLNGDKSVISTEEGSCSRSASTSAEEMWQETRESGLKKEVDTETEETPQVDSGPYQALKRKIVDKSSDSSNDPADNENISSASNLTSSHSNLLNADLLQSLQYFALLRQNFPTSGSLIHLPGLPQTSASQGSPPLLPPSKVSGGLNHSCPSCGICFSSVSTLSAHVTYYCSKSSKTRTENAPVSETYNGRVLTPEIPLDAGSDDPQSDRGPSAPKIRRSGRYYACPYCSFSADKRVSLNRHMRVHVGLPLLATNPVSPPPDDVPRVVSDSSRPLSDPPVTAESPPDHLTTKLMEGIPKPPVSQSQGESPAPPAGAERFCADCKIQFSSLKTYHVHKQHYCQYRKPSAVSISSDAPQNVAEGLTKRVSAAGEVASRVAPMTIFVLPTNPPIVVPLCILQSAQLLTADQPMPPHSVIVSSHGEVQFKADASEEQAPTEPTKHEDECKSARQAPAAKACAKNEDEVLDLSSKTSDAGTEAVANGTEGQKSASVAPGNIRIREELAHIQPSPESGSTAALPFLPPKVFAELEALGSYLGVPSGHEMASNPAQWLAMLENAVLQASSSSAFSQVSAGILSRNLLQAQKSSNSIPCEECNITFRRMESYLVHKQHYCAARHQAKEVSATPPSTSDVANGSVEDLVPNRESRIKLACNQCGVEFESINTLQAHRSFYCPKRDSSAAAVSAADPSPKNNRVSPTPTEKDSKKAPESTSQSPATAPPATTPTPRIVSTANGSPTASGSGSVQGWKCPCCDTVSPTAAAAQKHVETHSNVRAFRCSFCGYRGNTLRGMRTHVRIHFDRRNADLCEDNYITCIMSNDLGASSSCPGVSSNPPDVDHIFKSLGLAPEVCAKVLSSPAEGVTPLLSPKSREMGASSLAGLQFLQLAQRLANHSPGPTTGAGCRSDKLFLCDLCCYSSSYRGNVIRHSKLVHGREISDVAVVSSNFLQQQSPKLPNHPNAEVVRLKSAESPPRTATAAPAPGDKTTVSASQTCPSEESIQVKIDPDDVAICQQISPRSQSSPIPDCSRTELELDASTDALPKHCKSCNITFTYMSTFLAHKKYYCSSHTANAPAVSPEATHT